MLSLLNNDRVAVLSFYRKHGPISYYNLYTDRIIIRMGSLYKIKIAQRLLKEYARQSIKYIYL